MTKLAIIGGGLAGTALAKLLAERNLDFDWYRDDVSSASHISSGILNPVTGRRYASAWKYHELINVAKQFYKEYLIPIRLEKHYTSYKENTPVEDVIRGKEKDLTKINEQWVEVKNSYQLQTSSFIKHYTERLSEKNRVIHQNFQHNELTANGSSWEYLGKIYSQILFAEGIFVRNNPFFNYLNFRPNRGEALLIDIFSNKPTMVKKHGKFICPFGDEFWVGSSFDKVDFEAPLTTENTKQDLIQALPNLIEGNDYKILNHIGALRSTTFDRRPIIGEHPEHKGLYIFNGFGTKGASLIPWCALALIETILNSSELNEEVSITRLK